MSKEKMAILLFLQNYLGKTKTGERIGRFKSRKSKDKEEKDDSYQIKIFIIGSSPNHRLKPLNEGLNPR